MIELQMKYLYQFNQATLTNQQTRRMKEMAEEAVAGQSAGQANDIATISYGAYNQPIRSAGKTVDQIRNDLIAQWGMPKDAKGYSGKTVLEDSYVIKPGDKITFQKAMGEKGLLTK